MKRNILNGKTVQRIEHTSSTKLTVYYTDATHEEMDLKFFKLAIKEVKV